MTGPSETFGKHGHPLPYAHEFKKLRTTILWLANRRIKRQQFWYESFEVARAKVASYIFFNRTEAQQNKDWENKKSQKRTEETESRPSQVKLRAAYKEIMVWDLVQVWNIAFLRKKTWLLGIHISSKKQPVSDRGHEACWCGFLGVARKRGQGENCIILFSIKLHFKLDSWPEISCGGKIEKRRRTPNSPCGRPPPGCPQIGTAGPRPSNLSVPFNLSWSKQGKMTWGRSIFNHTPFHLEGKTKTQPKQKEGPNYWTNMLNATGFRPRFSNIYFASNHI
jgi:hypothetical protein